MQQRPLALTPNGCAYAQQWQAETQPGSPSQLTCHGDVAQFVQWLYDREPMELHAVVCRTVPAVRPTDGRANPVTTPLGLWFEPLVMKI